MTRNKHEGGGHPKETTPSVTDHIANVEESLRTHEIALQALEDERRKALAVMEQLMEERPQEADDISNYIQEELSTIDPQIVDIQARHSAKVIELHQLQTNVRNKEIAETRRKEAREVAQENKKAFDREILPEIHKQIESLHMRWEETEHIGTWAVSRAEEIERELKEYQGAAISAENAIQITKLVREFFELVMRMANMHHAAFGPNLKNKE